jgi:hypothetical protein
MEWIIGGVVILVALLVIVAVGLATGPDYPFI